MVGNDVVGAEQMLGQRVRALRLLANLPQTTLAEMAGVSAETVRSLENGHGTTVHTLLAVVRALGRQDWLNALAADAVTTSAIDEVCRMMVRKRARCVESEPSK